MGVDMSAWKTKVTQIFHNYHKELSQLLGIPISKKQFSQEDVKVLLHLYRSNSLLFKVLTIAKEEVL